jgi:hypothetical protein
MRPIALTTAALSGAALLAAAAVPAVASVDPSITVKPKTLTLGDTATIRGTSWVVGAGCSNKVKVTIQGTDDGEAWNAPVGTAKVDPSTGGIKLTFTPPESKFPAGKTTLVAKQTCPKDQGGTYVRKTKLTLTD